MQNQASRAGLSPRALLLLRVGVAVLIGVHPFSRMIKWNVARFGEFLTSQGLPLGFALAWAITIFELGGTVCLLWGRCVRLVVPGHIFILLMGILLVHGREGWFVVGGGRNGVEYSVLLIIALTSIWFATPPAMAAQQPTDLPNATRSGSSFIA